MMKTLMKHSMAVLGCLVLTPAFAGRAPTPPSPTELASGSIKRHAAGHTFVMGIPGGQAAAETDSVIVRFGDLDIEKSAGAAVLYSRLQHAARMVCPQQLVIDLSRLRSRRACYHAAVAQAVEKIDRPSLTALHVSRVPASRGTAS